MVADDRMGYGKTKTAPFPLGEKIGIEYLVDYMGGNTDSSILDAYFRKFPRWQDEVVGTVVAAFRILDGGDVFARDGDCPAVGHGMAGVEDNVLYHLAYLSPVNIHRPQIIRDVVTAGNLVTMQDKFR